MKKLLKKKTNLVLIFDVDGVLTTGNFFYDNKGKKYKIFGPDDNDAIKIIKNSIPIYFVTSDKRGYSISKKRIVDDMKCKLFLKNSEERLQWIKKIKKKVIYMGDSFTDVNIFKSAHYAIATNNCYIGLKKYADFITFHKGGERAVAEAIFHIIKKFKI